MPRNHTRTNIKRELLRLRARQEVCKVQKIETEMQAIKEKKLAEIPSRAERMEEVHAIKQKLVKYILDSQDRAIEIRRQQELALIDSPFAPK